MTEKTRNGNKKKGRERRMKERRPERSEYQNHDIIS